MGHGIFPLLFMRRCATFYPQNDSASMLPDATDVDPEDFRVRTSRLLEELRGLTQVPSTLWNVRVVGTLLEYCNCLWLKSFEAASSPPSMELVASSPVSAAAPLEVPSTECRRRAWVALEVLPGQPFHFAAANVVNFYSEMLTYSSTWLKDVQGMLPPDEFGCRLNLCEEDVRSHLSKVLLTVLRCWVVRVESARSDECAFIELRQAWPLIEGVLKSIMTASADQASRALGQENLGEEARCVHAHVSRLCGHDAKQEAKEEGRGLFSRSFLAPALPLESISGHADASSSSRDAAVVPNFG